MTRSQGRFAQGWVIGIHGLGSIFLALFAISSPALAAHTEVRKFDAKIDNKAAGSYTMTIIEGKEGKAAMTGVAEISVRLYLIKYTYHYEGTELWKGSRLQELKSETNDDGKQYVVQVQPDKDGLVVTSNGKEHVTRNDVWTTTYWRLPDPVYTTQTVHLLDADTGKDLAGTLQYAGKRELSIAGQKQEYMYFRLTGEKSNVQLWYDAKKRLVREELVEDGHTMVLDLSSIR